MEISLILADDHVVLRKGLVNLLSNHGFQIVAEVGDGIELIEVLKTSKADVVILDISMPKLGGLDAIEEIRKISDSIKIIMLTMHKDVEFLQRAISLGANGYVLKSTGEVQLVNAIKQVVSGEVAIDFGISEYIQEDFLGNLETHKSHPNDNLTVSLTSREVEILKLVAKGYTDKEISNRLYISVKTIEKHKTNIKKKIGVKRLAELIRYAVDRGFI
ncbi:hypothetical protein BHU72_07390 [Desulfuribacillus stibiiarsenatis]|uniref:DNA-binding response regulator n=1 Tax=Desulfuribacillus stibiiarsenatis TaxID=1390249 RepID=A0A1E5L4R5_9FIRM|nr:response regulator transcription factor [Desulfuribacillus stibiiarsenatis]OEH85003.1 hypothetical protein BHU72_07390 [Desulfuribacillus stibiiarsenatis]